MANNSNNDWQPPEDEPRKASRESAESHRDAHPPPGEGAAGPNERRPPQNPSMFDRGVEVLKLQFDRAINGDIGLAYLVLFGIWSLASGILGGALFAGLFAMGALGGSNPEIAAPAMITILGGGGLLFLVMMVAWQTLLVGLHRPMHRVMFRGPNIYSGVGDVLRAAVDRFFPILGVSAVIGVVVYGGLAITAGAGLVMSGVLGSGAAEFSPIFVFGLGGIWFVATLAVGFFFGPATYFIATREIGVFDALGTSFNFVLEHLVEMLVAWGIFMAGGMMFGCVTGVAGALPCIGMFIQLAANAIGGLLALMYWNGVFVLFEDEYEPERSIIW